VARFLSAEWFGMLEAAGGQAEAPERPDLVIEISVADGPEGEVRYEVVVDGEHLVVLPPGAGGRVPLDAAARVQFHSDYPTMAGIASGRLSAVDALAQGLARVGGDIAALSSARAALGRAELVPGSVRASTSF
jgi:hypothetical protein